VVGPLLVAWIVVTGAALLALNHATHSFWLGALALWGSAVPLRWMSGRAAASRPLPPYPDPPPRRIHPLTWRFWLLIAAAALLGTALGLLGSLLGGGWPFWMFAGFVAPLCVLVNRYGVQRPPKPVP